MLGPIIGLTTSIATIAATGLARGGAAVITGQGRSTAPRRQVIRRTIIQTNRESVAKLIAALGAEKKLRAQLQLENDRMRERLAVAEEAIDILMQERVAG